MTLVSFLHAQKVLTVDLPPLRDPRSIPYRHQRNGEHSRRLQLAFRQLSTTEVDVEKVYVFSGVLGLLRAWGGRRIFFPFPR